MNIADLNYLEYTPEIEPVFGGVELVLTASATGDNTFMVNFIDITSIGDGQIGKGFIKAIASGSDPFTSTEAFGGGDKVVTASVSATVPIKDLAFSASVIVAIDYPL